MTSEIVVALTPAETSIILKALSELPYKDSAGKKVSDSRGAGVENKKSARYTVNRKGDTHDVRY